jgi:hypothetical protein
MRAKPIVAATTIIARTPAALFDHLRADTVGSACARVTSGARTLLAVGIGLRDSQMSQDARRRVKQAYTRSDY